MLTIVCGEDSPSARAYYFQLKKQYEANQIQINEVNYLQIKSLLSDRRYHRSLFFDQTVYFSQNINKYISVRNNPEFVQTLQAIAQDENLVLIDWEENKSAREIKLKKIGTVKEFKLDQTIFKLQDSCFPGNVKIFLTLLHRLIQTSDEVFIFIMLTRHIRVLLMVKNQLFPKQIAPWQKHKFLTQSKYWTSAQLLMFYHGLYRIDLSTKTSRNPLGIMRSLDILACSCL